MRLVCGLGVGDLPGESSWCTFSLPIPVLLVNLTLLFSLLINGSLRWLLHDQNFNDRGKVKMMFEIGGVGWPTMIESWACSYMCIRVFHRLESLGLERAWGWGYVTTNEWVFSSGRGPPGYDSAPYYISHKGKFSLLQSPAYIRIQYTHTRVTKAPKHSWH